MITNLVSIITPAYKAARFIESTVHSVQQQDYPDWEMLVVDDGSPDDTAELTQKLVNEDPRIRLIRQANAGPAMARQRGLDEARGRYVAFLDSDDFWLPGKLSAQLAFMRDLKSPMSYTSFRRINADATLTGRLVRIPPTLDYSSLLCNTAIATSSVIVDRALTGPFAMQKAYYDDFVLWLNILKRGLSAHGLQEDLLRYRVVNNSVSRNKLKSAREVWRTYREIERLPLPYASWCFSNYALKAAIKYRVF